MFKDLHKIIKETPVLLVPTLEGYDRGKFRTAQGVAIQQMPNDKSMKCTIINYNCDDMAHTLMHESFHHYYPTGLTNEKSLGYWPRSLVMRVMKKNMVILIDDNIFRRLC